MSYRQGALPPFPPVQPQVAPGTPQPIVNDWLQLIAVWHHADSGTVDLLLKWTDTYGLSWTFHVRVQSWGRPMDLHRWRW
jgi:hypothetical protein